MTRRVARLFIGLLAGLLCWGQANVPSLRGKVADPSGASIPGAQVRLRNASNRELRAVSNERGEYEFKTLVPGSYSIRVLKEGFALYEIEQIDIQGPLKFDVGLTIAAEKQILNVEEEQANVVTTESGGNVGQLTLKGEDLKTLSDDPDILAQELQALAGPGAGPNGGQIFIDGFSGGRLPPKGAIREIRINQNPYSPEFDRIGFGRIEILTKPGADKFRGDVFFNFTNQDLLARNPFAANKAPFQSILYGGRISGPINKRSSYALDVENRAIDENAIINATVLNAQLQPSPFSLAVVTPQRRISISPRWDYAINDRNTFIARYSFQDVNNDNQGIGQFALQSRAFDTTDRDHSLQLTETAILSARAINETRFQFQRSVLSQNGDNTLPAIDVLQSFNAGGAQIGNAGNKSNSIELSNITTYTPGAHSIKWGGRLRSAWLTDINPNNFGGTFTFTGGLGALLDANNQPIIQNGQPVQGQITSLERYRRTLLFQQQGLSPAQIRLLGGGANQFSISGGNPLADVRQSDIGIFLNDDWRARPNLTLSYGLRYENQNNISSNLNFAPRIGLAWGIDGGKNKQAKTVLRVGSGIFYDRIAQNLTLQALRFNGVNQLQFLVPNPDFFPNVPPLSSLEANRVNQVIRRLDSTVRAPYLIQSSVGLDRQLPKNIQVAVNYVFTRGVHDLRTRNINAPKFGQARPFGDIGNLFMFETTGHSRGHELRANFSARMKRGFLFGAYRLGFARSDTDGFNTPADPYDLSTEWGRSARDIRNFFITGSSINLKWGVSMNPFIFFSTGGPFNITTGRDNNGDTQFADRPSLAAPGATGRDIVATRFGTFNLNPGPGEQIIPRNYGQGPTNFRVNLRMSRSWGFGKRGESGPGDGVMPPGMRTGGGPGGPGGGGRGPGGGGPPPGVMMGGGGGRGGPGGFFGGGNTGKRYNVTLSVQAQNLLNRVNPAAPVGNLSSPLFGQFTQLGGFFGGGPGGGGPFGGGAAGNRRIDVQLRFSF